MTDAEDQEDIDEKPAQIYATRQTLGYLQSIGINPAQIPEINGKKIIFVQQGDVTPGTAGRDKEGARDDHAVNYAITAVTGSPRGPNVTSRSGEYMSVEQGFAAQAVPELKKEGNMPGNTPMYDIPNVRMLATVNNNALKGDEPSAGNLGANGAVVSLPAAGQTTQQVFARILAIDPANVTGPIPGTDADWARMMVYHELGHVADPDTHKGASNDTDRLKLEVTGDNFALSQWRKESGDPGVSQAWRDARLLSGFGDAQTNELAALKRGMQNATGWIQSGQFFAEVAGAVVDNVGDHTTHPLLNDENGAPAIADPRHNAELSGMIKVNTMVAQAVGVAEVAAGNFDVLNKIHGDMKLFSKNGDNGPEKNNFGDAVAMAEAGNQSAVKNFAALNALKDRGAFKEGTPEAAYADRIIALQNKYLGGMKNTPEYKATYDAVKNLPDDGFEVKVAPRVDGKAAFPEIPPPPTPEENDLPKGAEEQDNTSHPGATSHAAKMADGSLTGDDWQDETADRAPDASGSFRTAATNTKPSPEPEKESEYDPEDPTVAYSPPSLG